MRNQRLGSIRDANVPLYLFVLTIGLLTVGIITVYSSSASVAGFEHRLSLQRAGLLDQAQPSYHALTYVKKQLFWAALGLGAMAFFYHFDYRRLKNWSFWIMAGCFVLCLLVWVPGVGVKINGAQRWIALGPVGLQPSEFAKLGLIIYMAKMLDDRRRFIKSFFSGVFPGMIVAGAFATVVVLQPDFGSAFILCLIVFGMWLCGEVRWFHLSGLAMAGVPALIAAFVLKPYRMRRMFAFFSDDPETLLHEGFQLHQSLIAIGSGGIQGLGLGASAQKQAYVFAGHTDFIFSIFAEEMGFLRTSLLIAAFAALVGLGFWIAINTSDLFGSLLAAGITLMIFAEVSINMGVVLGLLPTKGLVLPLISYGGSSLIVTLGALGILMNIGAREYQMTARSGVKQKGRTKARKRTTRRRVQPAY